MKVFIRTRTKASSEASKDVCKKVSNVIEVRRALLVDRGRAARSMGMRVLRGAASVPGSLVLHVLFSENEAHTLRSTVSSRFGLAGP